MLPLKERFTSNISTVEIRGTSDSAFENTSNLLRPKVSFSIFDETDCGEPLPAQRLTMDFTPVEGVDNDYVQRKCCAFWDFIHSRTDLHHMIVMPEKNLYEVSEPSLTVQKPPEVQVSMKEATAVSMLEFVEGKGLIDRTFEAKLPQSMCLLGSREYLENTSPQRTKRAVCTCKGVCKICTRLVSAAPDERSSPEVQFLCEKMTDWDRVHPKSMEPPGHPPALKTCIMQRKVPT